MEAKKPGSRSGQAVIEYVLLLVLVATVVSMIAISFRTQLFKLWGGMASEVAAPCPTSQCAGLYREQNPGVKVDPSHTR